MRVVFESSILIPDISETLLILTSGARIQINNIQYDRSKKIVDILLERKELIGFRTSFFGRKWPIYGKKTLKTLLTVRNVVSMKITTDERLINELDSTFTLLLGAMLKENELYLGSVEESQGVVFCQVSIKFDECNIECVDVDNLNASTGVAGRMGEL